MGEVKDALLQRTRQGWNEETEPLRLDGDLVVGSSHRQARDAQHQR